MIERQIHLSSGGGAALQGDDGLLRFGYTKNRGIYALRVNYALPYRTEVGPYIRIQYPGLLAPARREPRPLHAGGGRPCGGARPHHGCARGGAHYL